MTFFLKKKFEKNFLFIFIHILHYILIYNLIPIDEKMSNIYLSTYYYYMINICKPYIIFKLKIYLPIFFVEENTIEKDK